MDWLIVRLSPTAFDCRQAVTAIAKLAIFVTVSCLYGCSLNFLKDRVMAVVTSEKDDITLTSERFNELDQATYAYSDRFVTLVADACDSVAKNNPNKAAKSEALRLKLHNASSMYAIATGPNPLGQLLDIATVVTLNKIRLVDEGQALKIFGGWHQPIEHAFNAAYDDIWRVAQRFLKDTEIASIKRIIKDWREKHPEVSTLAYTRFDDFARARAGLVQQEPEIGTLFDELSHASRAVETAQQFGERTFFYVQRLPRLLQWQTERTIEGVMNNSDMQKLQDSVHLMADATLMFSKEMKRLDEHEQHMQKSLDKVSNIMNQVHALAPKAQAALQDSHKLIVATEKTSNALSSTLQVADQLSARYTSDDKTIASDDKPFDINEYKTTFTEATLTLNEANRLLENIATQDLDKRTADMQALIDKAINNALWKFAQLALFVFGLALLYRWLAIRIK